MITPALPDFFGAEPEAQTPVDPLVQQMQEGEWTGKDIYEYFMANGEAEFTFDDQGRDAFKKVMEYKRNKDIEIIGPLTNAVGQMGSEIAEGVASAPNPLTDPGRFAASSAEGAYRGLRDIYGVLFES